MELLDTNVKTLRCTIFALLVLLVLMSVSKVRYISVTIIYLFLWLAKRFRVLMSVLKATHISVSIIYLFYGYQKRFSADIELNFLLGLLHVFS